MNKFLPFLLLVALPFYSRSQCALIKPTGLKVTSVSSCDAHVSWNPVSGSAFYMLRYKKDGAQWIVINTGVNTSYVVPGLLPNTNYSFSVESYCPNHKTKGYCAAVEKKTLPCPVPLNPTATVTTNSAKISWQPQCGSSAYNIRYHLTGVSQWINIPNIAATSYQINGLASGKSYDYQIQARCGTKKSSWSATQTFTTLNATLPIRNILIVMVDDGRYDTYQENGGPSWFNNPAISRIAAEGVNFRVTCPGTSQCGPSRATFYTGLYAHHNGCLNNGDHLYPSLPLIQQILKDHGYYTGFVGKYGQGLGLPKGFDYYAISSNDNYLNVTYTINGVDTFIPGHISDIYPMFALDFLNQVPSGKPFALFYFQRAPHGPTIPRPEDEDLYVDDPIPFPDNFYNYDHDYPSYYYNSNHDWPFDSLQTDSIKLLEYQAIAGVEDNVDTLTDWLEAHQVLDSTFLMYTSDNGYMKGEHLMLGKEIAQEESIRLPLFIRYPKWFNSSTVITDQIASNIDIAPTLLEFAGIPDTFGMDGVSLHQLATHQVIRRNFLYEFGQVGPVPSLRAVRSLQYKYIYNFCSSTVEEFYDLVNDPKENNNLIGNSSYSALIQTYRMKLDSLRTTFTDTDPPTVPCYLVNPTMPKFSEEENEEELYDELSLRLNPDPASQYFNVHYFGKDIRQPAEITVFNMFGDPVFTQQVILSADQLPVINCSTWTTGVYLVQVNTGGNSVSQRIVVSR